MTTGSIFSPTPRGRPGYAPAIDLWLRDGIGLTPHSRVAELGAGQGKFSAHILRQYPQSVAVEPDADKRIAFARNLPNARIVAGRAERIPLGRDTLNGLLVAQAFHWFANAEALAEMSRVLKPDGKLALIWNIRDESVGWVQNLSRLIEPMARDVPRFHDGTWRGALQRAGFREVSEDRFCHAHSGPAREVIVERILSVRFVARQPAPLRDQLRRDLEVLIAETPELANGQTCRFPYVTMAYVFAPP